MCIVCIACSAKAEVIVSEFVRGCMCSFLRTCRVHPVWPTYIIPQSKQGIRYTTPFHWLRETGSQILVHPNDPVPLTNERVLYISHITSNCAANTSTTHTTVRHHTHLVLKVDIRFESDEDLNSMWMTMMNSYHQSSNIILEEEERSMDSFSLTAIPPNIHWHKVTMSDAEEVTSAHIKIWQHGGMTRIPPQVVHSSSDGTCECVITLGSFYWVFVFPNSEQHIHFYM